MNNPSITSKRFAQLLEAYGGHPQRWPEEERQAALQFLEHSALAQDMYRQTCQLDHYLDCAPPPPKISKHLILTSIPLSSWSQILLIYKDYLLRPVLISLISLLLGIVIGLSMTFPVPGNEEDMYLLAFNENLL